MPSVCVPEGGPLADIAQKLRHYAGASRAPATLQSYQDTWRAFTAWCQLHQRCPLPSSAETAALFLSDLAGRYKPSTLSRMLSGIAFAHRVRGHGFDASGCGDVLSGIRRTHGTAPRQVSALTLDLLVRIDQALPRSTAGVRDRALLLLGFAGALRRSELVGLNVGVRTPGCTGLVRFGAQGAQVNLLRSKTDQEAVGLVKGIVRGGPVCAVGALEQWLQVAGINEGPIFRSVDKGGSIGARRLTDRSVPDIVKRSVKCAAIVAGLSDRDADHASQQFAGHSLRAGFATSAAAAGITGETMARHVGWTNGQMATRYVRQAELFKSNPLHAVFSGTAAGGAPVRSHSAEPEFLAHRSAAQHDARAERTGTSLSRAALKRYIASLPTTVPITARYERALAGRWKAEVWYTSQKEHWIGWLRGYHGPGPYGRQEWKRDAAFIYNHVVCPPMILWLAEAAEVPGTLIKKAAREADIRQSLMSQAAAIRRVLPWTLVGEHLRNLRHRDHAVSGSNLNSGRSLARSKSRPL